MSVFRINNHKNFTIMSNVHLRDKNLSLKAKGLMSQMLSLPEDWDYSIQGLIAINKEAEVAVKSALKELKEAGYLVVTKLYANETDSGHIEYIYDLYEEPQLSCPPVNNQGVQNVPLENQVQLNTKEQNTKELSTDNKERKVQKRDALIEILEENEPTASNEELRQSFIDFIQMRKLIKKPLTEKALMLAINKAYALANGDISKMVAIVDQSVMNSWQGLFELKDNKPAKVSGTAGRGNDAMAQLEALAAEEGITL